MQNIRTTSDIAELLLERLQSGLDVNTIKDSTMTSLMALLENEYANRRFEELRLLGEGYDD
jgi:hypothetical protein